MFVIHGGEMQLAPSWQSITVVLAPAGLPGFLWQAALLLAVIPQRKFSAPELNIFRIRLVMFDYCNKNQALLVNNGYFMYVKFHFC